MINLYGLELFTGLEIDPRLQALAVIFSLALLVIIIQLVRKERLKEGYSLVWIAVALIMFVFSLYTPMLRDFAGLVGISYTPAGLILIILGGLLLLSLHFSLLFCRFDKRIRRLAQEHAILKEQLLREIEELKQHKK